MKTDTLHNIMILTKKLGTEFFGRLCQALDSSWQSMIIGISRLRLLNHKGV